MLDISKVDWRKAFKIAVWNWRIFLYWEGVRFQKFRRFVYRRLNLHINDPPTAYELYQAWQAAEAAALAEKISIENEKWIAETPACQSDMELYIASAKRAIEEHTKYIAENEEIPIGWTVTPIYKFTFDERNRLRCDFDGLHQRYEVTSPDGCRVLFNQNCHVLDGDGWTIINQSGGFYFGFLAIAPSGATLRVNDLHDA